MCSCSFVRSFLFLFMFLFQVPSYTFASYATYVPDGSWISSLTVVLGCLTSIVPSVQYQFISTAHPRRNCSTWFKVDGSSRNIWLYFNWLSLKPPILWNIYLAWYHYMISARWYILYDIITIIWSMEGGRQLNTIFNNLFFLKYCRNFQVILNLKQSNDE